MVLGITDADLHGVSFGLFVIHIGRRGEIALGSENLKRHIMEMECSRSGFV